MELLERTLQKNFTADKNKWVYNKLQSAILLINSVNGSHIVISKCEEPNRYGSNCIGIIQF